MTKFSGKLDYLLFHDQVSEFSPQGHCPRVDKQCHLLATALSSLWLTLLGPASFSVHSVHFPTPEVTTGNVASMTEEVSFLFYLI